MDKHTYRCTTNHLSVIYTDEDNAPPTSIRCTFHHGDRGTTHYPDCGQQHTCDKEAARLISTWI